MEIVGSLRLVKNKYAVTNKCINFKTKAQEDLLISQFEGVSFNSGLFMQDGDAILVPLNYEECIKYNYCYFNNKVDNINTKRYFCYITNYQYVEPNVTRINIAVDTLQTFMFDIDKFRGNMSRCHSARRINVGTEETPRYIINPDLYFMEDDVDLYKAENYISSVTTHQTYVVLTMAIPSTMSNNVGWNEDGGYYQDISLEEIFYDNATKYKTYSRLYFPVSSGNSYSTFVVVDENIKIYTTTTIQNRTTRGIGDTKIFTIIIPTASFSFSSNNQMTFELFEKLFPTLVDKIVDIFYIDDVGDATPLEDGIRTTKNANITFDNLTDDNSNKFQVWYMPSSQKGSIKQLIQVEDNTVLSPTGWANRNDDLLSARRIGQEKKLDLYPYSFVKVLSMGSELIWKYQEMYKSLINTNTYKYTYSFLKVFDVLAPNPHMNSTLLYDLNNLIDASNSTFNNLKTTTTPYQYYFKYSDTKALPSISIYQEKYTEYLNYQKAIVDANNHLNMTGGIISGALGVGSAMSDTSHILDIENKHFAFERRHAGANKDYDLAVDLHHARQRGIAAKGTWGVAGAVAGGLGGIGNYITTALKENAIKKQPMNNLHQGTTSDEIFTKLFTPTGNVYDYIVTKYDVVDNLKSIYEQKFYNYGYSIPVDVEFTHTNFMNIIKNRQYFCYMEWNSLEIEGDIPTIYMNDIVSRLTNGVRFENTSGTTLFPTYTQLVNNKETMIPTKPFFVSEY